MPFYSKRLPILTTGTALALTMSGGLWIHASAAQASPVLAAQNIPLIIQAVPVAAKAVAAAAAAAAAPPVAGTSTSVPVPAAPAAAPGDITVTARDQPVSAFLRDLFGRIGRPVVTSPNLTGTVNGVFRGSVNKIYADIAKAFNLISYDDGAALYVYAASEVGVQTLNVGQATAQRVARQVASQRLVDRRNYVRIAADGNLVASGTPRFLQQVSAMTQGGGGAATGGGAGAALPGYGAPLAPAIQPLEFRVFYLRYARAEDTTTTSGGQQVTVPGLATIIQNLVLDQKPGGSALMRTSTNQIGSRPVRQSLPRLKGYGLDSVAPNLQQTPLLGLPYAGQYPGQQQQSDVLGLGGDTGAPLTSDIVRIEPNPYLNAIIIRDVPERMASYDSLIRALDVEPQIIEIEATIIDINTDKARDLGINWRISSGGFGFLFGNGTASDRRLLPNNNISRRDDTNQITPTGLGGSISTIIGNGREFLGRITALEQKGVARIVSRPQLLTLSNVEAVFDRTKTFYVRVAGREEVDLFNVTAGTILRVNPHVFRDHDQSRIRMIINIEDGGISGRSRVDKIPVIDKSSVSTQAMVVDGESLLLGGMTVDQDAETLDKIPFLADIPLLGNLFKFQHKESSHTERLFLISPRLVSLGSRVGPTTVTTNTQVVPTPAAPIETVPVPASGGAKP